MMNYEDIAAHSAWSNERVLHRYCTRTQRVYTVSWTHVPSWYMRGPHKMYLN